MTVRDSPNHKFQIINLLEQHHIISLNPDKELFKDLKIKLRRTMHTLTVKIFYILHAIVFISAVASLANPEEDGPYFEGDIIRPLLTPFNGRLDQKYRWNNKTVHYEFESNYPAELQATFEKAIEHISERTCIRFQPRSEQDPDYISVISSSSCYSYVGRQGGKQVISLPKKCNALGTFIHEIIHALGFHHEQSRTDRDEHVEILWENVLSGKETQFRKYESHQVTSYDVPYDLSSIMHYSRFAFSKDEAKLETIVPLNSTHSQVEIGQRKGMSFGDITKVNKMYNCV